MLHDDFIKECVKKNFRRVLDLVHQNIAICKGLGQDEVTGISYLIMEYVEGINLRVWINSKRQEGTLTLDTVISIIKQISNALEYALDEDMIYPNIRPENIMIDVYEGNLVTLLDKEMSFLVWSDGCYSYTISYDNSVISRDMAIGIAESIK